jgi:2',3'-cyclic-nucleotide 2'-phosphodiesterase (5'-nucleotidase family)
MESFLKGLGGFQRLIAIIVAAILLATTLIVGIRASLAEAKGQPDRTPVTIQFLSVSDWHGQLDPLDISGVGRRGGASVISTYWKADRLQHPNTLTLTAGDDFGAAPPLSNFFDERPAVLAERMMGIQVNTFGNHNFDRGIAHLQDMIDLAGAATSVTTPGSPYEYVSANLQNRDDNLDGVEDFTIIEVGGLKVGVVGITNPEAPELVFPGSFGTIVPTDPVPAANRAKAAAKQAGADIVIALIHAGVRGFDSTTGEPFGELIDFANNVGGFDVIFGDHTDIEFSGVINGQLVVEARSKGRTYAKTLLTVDPQNVRVLDQSVEFVSPICLAVDAVTGACTATPRGAPDPAIEAMLLPFRTELIPILSTVIGQSAVEVPRTDKCGSSQSRLCESLVGNAVTDAMRTTYGTDIALTNSGGLRSPLTCPAGGGGSGFCPASTPPPWPITRGQVLTLLPFGNQSATLEVTGAEVKAMLENGVSRTGEQGRFPQVSGFCFTYDVGLPAGSRVTGAVWQAADGSCTGAPFDLTAGTTYSIATNDFVASGGDGYPNFASRMVTRNIMANDVVDWVAANSPISPAIQGRITCTTSGAQTCPVVTP